MSQPTDLTKKEAIEFLGIPEKNFDNYVKSSKEIAHYKKSGRYYFKENELIRWRDLKNSRTVFLSMDEYTKCFILAIQMAYTKKPSAGTGIRGVRSEMQVSDDWIFGIMAEFALKKFLKENYGIEIELDTEPHPKEGITAQDIVEVDGREPRIRVGMKASKEKSCWLVLDQVEVERENRQSDMYIFARVGLPSDHLFRILREHSFFDIARKKLSERVAEQEEGISGISQQIKQKVLEKESLKKESIKMRPGSTKDKIKVQIKSITEEIKELEQESKSSVVFRNIESLPSQIPIWLCGYTNRADLRRTKEIPGQTFSGDRWVRSVAELRNLDADWQEFVSEL